mgnify:FL=1
MNADKKKKISEIVWPIIYFLLVVTICFSGCLVFRRYYYCSVFVSGQSMAPTLLGGKGNGDYGIANFGLVDTTDLAKKKTKRFDIVTTYYPWDTTDYPSSFVPGEKNELGESAERKIKRILGLPGETISVKNGDITISRNAYYVEDIKEQTTYKFGVSPSGNETYHNYYFSGVGSTYLSITYNFDSKVLYSGEDPETPTLTTIRGATNVILAPANNGQYYFLYEANVDDYRYLNVSTSGNSHTFAGEMTPSTLWTIDSSFNTISTKIMNHTSSNLDGDYVFTFSLNTESEGSSKLSLTKVSELNLEEVSVVKFMEKDADSYVTYFPQKLEKTDILLDVRKNDCKNTNYTLPFRRGFDNRPFTYKDFDEVVLKNNRYWVQGDHWGNSTDCYNNGPIYLENMEGVLVVIEGTCTIGRDNDGNKVCTDHKYKSPIFF